MQKILIVEDDEKIKKWIRNIFKPSRLSGRMFKKFDNTIHDILEINPNLILLDINLPGVDGEYICKEIRKQSDMGIIIVTSRDNELDELVSINYGADHYITKPFNIHILLAKVNSLLRRTNSNSEPKNKIDAKDFILNISNSTIIKDDKIIDLTKNEYKILKYFIENREKIVSREDIMDVLWENDCFVDDNTLSVNITRLRSKLEELGLKDIIETKRGQGYMLKGEKWYEF